MNHFVKTGFQFELRQVNEVELIITVVVCTFNRAEFLKLALRSLVNQTLDKSKFEVLIVDNNSTDRTQEVVSEFSEKHNNFRICFETKQGLSHARNRGWRESLGRYVAFLDDDAIACSEWLENILRAFGSISPTPGCVGGKIDLSWPLPRPEWIADEMLHSLGYLDSSPEITLLEDGSLFGGNMAVPRKLLDSIGGFNPDLGRGAEDLLGSEEVLLQFTIREMGFSIFYDPEILVFHTVHAERLKKKWFLSRAYWQGISSIRDKRMRGEICLLLRMKGMLKSSGVILGCSLKFCVQYDDQKRMSLLTRVFLHFGQIKEFLRMEAA